MTSPGETRRDFGIMRNSPHAGAMQSHSQMHSSQGIKNDLVNVINKHFCNSLFD